MANRITALEEFCGSGGCTDWDRRAWTFAELVVQTACSVIKGEPRLIRSGFSVERKNDGLLDLMATFYGWGGCNSDHRVSVKIVGYELGRPRGMKIAQVTVTYRNRANTQPLDSRLTVPFGDVAFELTLGKDGWTGVLEGQLLRKVVDHFGLYDQHCFAVATEISGEVLLVRYGSALPEDGRRLKRVLQSLDDTARPEEGDVVEERIPFTTIAEMRHAAYLASMVLNSDWAAHRLNQARAQSGQGDAAA